MKETIIDCSPICTREDLHRTIQEALSLPQWYGNNLDALHDCLTEAAGTLHFLDWDAAESRLGDYGKKAKKAILAAARENPALKIQL